MRVVVIGAGAIGTVVAAAAVDSGHDVAVCVRRPLEALRIERDGTSRALDAKVVTDLDDPALSEPTAVIFVTTKVGDTAGAGEWVDRLCGPETLVAAVQNGLDQDVRLRPYAASEWVVPALAYIAAERTEPGHVVHIAGKHIIVPAGDAEKLVDEAIGAGGLVVRGANDMRTACWRKLLGNLVANPITTLTLRRIGVMHDPGIQDLARGLLLEAVEVGRAEGAQVGEDDVSAIVEGTAQYGSRTGSSMLYDRLAGLPLEHQYLTGEVVRRAETHGIPVPLNSAILALLDALDRGEPGAKGP